MTRNEAAEASADDFVAYRSDVPFEITKHDYRQTYWAGFHSGARWAEKQSLDHKIWRVRFRAECFVRRVLRWVLGVR